MSGWPLKRKAGVAVWLCLFAWLALLPAHDGAAQDRSRSPSPESLWETYPLAPTAEPDTQPKQASTPPASARADRRPVGADRADSNRGAPVFVLVLLALVAAGGMLTFVGIRRRREGQPAAAAVTPPSRSAAGGHPAPVLWHGASNRFSRAVTKTTARATATATPAATGRPDDKRRPGAADDRSERDAPAVRAKDKATPVIPAVAPASAALPPDPRLTWGAEIEWSQIDGESRFRVMARGSGTVELARSAPLEWPPEGPAAVQAITDAADELAATLTAAGWTSLPPGAAWYAKRFAWTPAAAEPVPSGSTGAKPVAPPRPVPRVPASREGEAPDRVRNRRSRALQAALLGVLAVVGLIAAVQFGDGSDDAPAARSAPKPQDSIDLTVPLLALAGVLVVVLIIRQVRRALR